ncbi:MULTISPECIES: ABC transporter permease subunit [unclassified Streptomyces]|uniref:ABC transporter permease subunit n=1 Tax=unclassified Streptomyces TaxID=2593676 RepID=UPI00035F9644|nr:MULTISPECIES: ABC transporter permease subunit [unclassified Streptomyces]MYT30989.1 ABC transporter permease subunit [Streptomyces sp. SID8354]
MSTATTHEAAAVGGTTSGPLRGTLWLVWRRHRTALLTGILVTLAACALFSYQRIGLMGFLGGHDAGGTTLDEEFRSRFGSAFGRDLQFLEMVPVLVAVFLGAPLISSELERGTLRLVTTQSVSRGRWLAATLALPLTVVTVCTVLLSAVFQWLWSPAHSLVVSGDWLTSGPFDVTGPMLVAKTLFLTACGVALGKLIKRVVPAMLATAVAAAAVSVVWGAKVRPVLGTLRSTTYPYHGDGPHLAADTVRMDDWVATADGRLFGFGTCVHNAHPDACRAKLGIVNNVTQYFSYDQMPGMQWLGAGILLALTAVVLAFVVWRAHRRPL